MGNFNQPNRSFSADTVANNWKAKFFKLSIVTAVLFCLAGVSVHKLLAKPVNKKALSQAWSIVKEALTSSDSTMREQVVQALATIDSEQTTNTLMSALRDESEYVRIWAARSLAQRKNPAGKPVLLAILNRRDPPAKNATGPLAALEKMKALARGRVRGEAAKALGLINDSSLIPILKEAKKDDDGRVRDGAAVALALLGDSAEGVVFASAVKDPDRGVRLAAAEALQAMGDIRFVSSMEMLSSDSEASVRSVAAKALGAMKSTDSGTILATMLTDNDGVVRESAAWALGEAGVFDKVSALKASLSDPNFYVRIAAAEALGKLGKAEGLPVLEAILNSNDTEARAKAASAMHSINHDNMHSLATKTLSDGNLRVRLGAALSLLKSNTFSK